MSSSSDQCGNSQSRHNGGDSSNWMSNYGIDQLLYEMINSIDSDGVFIDEVNAECENSLEVDCG